MYCDYKTLVFKGIEVFSVKTDAFTIKAGDLELAKSCLEFSKDIGGWRFSKMKILIYQLITTNTNSTMK